MLLIRITCLISVFISLILGIIHLRKRNINKYFCLILMSLVALLLSYSYYLALEVDDSLDYIFTLGVFGEVSSYLFIILANDKFIPECGEHKFSLLGFIGAFISLGIIIAGLIIDFSVDNIITSILLISLSICVYFSLSVLENKNHNEYKRGIKISNILISLICIFSTFIQLLISYLEVNAVTTFIIIIVHIFYFSWDICIILLPIVLGKELKSWEK